MTPHAYAQIETALRVERADDTDDCPGADQLAAKIAAIRGIPAIGDRRYEVRFDRVAGQYTAVIRSASDSTGVRSIASTSRDCTALGQATAVTLALLFDADGARPAPQPTAAPPATETPSIASLRVAIEVGAVFSVVRSVAPAFAADGGVTWAALHAGLGALLVPQQRIQLEPGSIAQSLVAGRARLCYAPLRLDSWRLDLCSGFYAGAIRASARGFTQNHQVSRLFTALPLELGVLQLGGKLGWQLNATLLIPIRRNQFTIDGVGDVYRSGAIAWLITLGGVGLFGL